MQPSVLVVGAGLAGLCLARELVRRGFQVTLLSDPSAPAASRAATGLLQVAGGRISRSHLRLRQACRAHYTQFLAELGLACSEGHLRLGEQGASLASFASTLRGLGLRAGALTPAEVEALEPGLRAPAGGAVLMDTAWLDPGLLLCALEEAIEGRVRRRVGRVVRREGTTVVDAEGQSWSAGVIVLACGAGLSALHDLPYQTCPGWGIRHRVGTGLRHSLEWPGAGESLVPLEGCWRLGGVGEGMPSRLLELLPAVGAELERSFGVRLATPDGLPVAGRLEDGVYVLGALARNGLLTAPLLAAGVAEAIGSGIVPEWLLPLAPTRPGIATRKAWSR